MTRPRPIANVPTGTAAALLAVTLLAAVACAPGPPETATPPNVVLIVGDDFGFPYHSFLGADHVITPTFDELAAGATVFTNGYGPANHCRPSLRSMITGLLPIQYDAVEARNRAEFMASDRWDVMSDAEQDDWAENYQFNSMQDVPTLARALSEHGYLTWQGGKWWEFNYQNGGFTHGMTTGWEPEDRQDDGWFLQFMGGDGRELARVTNQPAYDFIDEAGDQPFFIWYAPELPHYPFDAPNAYYDLYADAEMTESAKRYFANASWFDERLGEFLDYLDEKGLRENTLVVYINDNGWEQELDQEFVGDPMRFNNGGDKGKLGLTDLSFRTPVIFSWPGRIEGGRQLDALVHAADLTPTILEYAGVDVPSGLFGRSLAGILDAGEGSVREELVGRVTQLRWEGDMMGRAANAYWVREGPWYFSWDLDSDEVRLFDVSEDPRADVDQAGENPDLVRRFQGAITAWRETYEGTANGQED